MNNYIINFFTWYYLIKVKNFAAKVGDDFMFSMNKSDTSNMIKFFKTPLYQDNSSFGKAISIFIRFWWIIFGTIYSAITVIPKVILLGILIILPFIPVLQLINILI